MESDRSHFIATALILGIGGQTGAYLARELLLRGQHVVGTSRSNSGEALWRLRQLGIASEIEVITADLSVPREVSRAVRRFETDAIYLLTGPSSVGKSFSNPLQTFREVHDPLRLLLSVIRESGTRASLVNASSTDCFGNQPKVRLNEESRFEPVSPYGVAKAATFWSIQNARRAYGLNVSNAILSNHESPLRGSDFVTHKIVTTLKEIAEGKAEKLVLGNISISRDWLWAGDVARALALIAESPEPDDYMVASGESHTLSELVERMCEKLGLVFEDVVTSDPALYRPTEIPSISLNPEKVQRSLGWEPRVDFDTLIDSLVSGDLL